MSNPIAEPEAVSRAMLTDDDWREIRADIKEIVNLLRLRALEPEAAEPKRKFRCDPDEWLRWIQPTPERLETFADVLLSMFIRNEDGTLMLGGKRIESLEKWLPTFADKLTIQIPIDPASQDVNSVSPGCKVPGMAARIRRYILEKRAQALEFDEQRMAVPSTSWQWIVPRSGFLALYFIHGNSESDEYEANSNLFDMEGFDDESPPASTHGYGTLCMIHAPILNGVLDIYWVNLVIALISRWNYVKQHNQLTTYDDMHFGSVMYFLGVFAGSWPSRIERSRFSCVHDYHNLIGQNFRRYYLQAHFRYFTGVESPMTSQNLNGLRCYREQGEIVSDIPGLASYFFEERRISVFGLISGNAADDFANDTPAFFSVLVLGEHPFRELDKYDLKWRPGLEGTIAFQLAVLASLDLWETEWYRMLDGIDDCLRIGLKEIDKWMFDDNFERSKLYFTVLQILRIFGDRIRTVSSDLHMLDDLFLKRTDFPMRRMRQHELQAMRSNWELVRATQKKAERCLLDRILSKTEEMKSLRDGLFNATSLREANRSSVMGRYVLIFTVVTVLYLPPSFISTVLDMDIFKKNDLAETTWEYKVSLVSVSLFTYIVALAGVIAVNWKALQRRSRHWWDGFKKGKLASNASTAGIGNSFAANIQDNQSPV
ncbi:hypothetical protein O1611_g7486 [Lasiodiplodia mahajangana]|uniref:Uncharacterized protein n=1 Tax=Lasiodiplodia mahajangana TaxID=1108764 RepID=A0ACC2JFG3_9PEZI|nr:hypothetical protein O1611_g7486 [Lasiodiplodia mahajangana]